MAVLCLQVLTGKLWFHLHRSSVGGNTLSATSVTDGSFSSVTERTLSESEEDEEEEEHPGSQESSWDSAR